MAFSANELCKQTFPFESPVIFLLPPFGYVNTTKSATFQCTAECSRLKIFHLKISYIKATKGISLECIVDCTDFFL